KEDHTIQTALLESRIVTGDKKLFEELEERFRKEVAAKTHASFVAAKLKERDDRHTRAGASRYMVEPNIKEGKGGLRDLHTLFWLARHRYGFTRPREYVESGIFTADDMNTARRAEEFLWTVRCHLHFLTGRAEERISFDLQPEMAQRMGYGKRGDQEGVERFMKRYFLVAKQVGALTRILCAKLETDQAKPAALGIKRLRGEGKRVPQIDDPGFYVTDNWRLNIATPDVFDDPVNLLKMFEIADQHDLDVHPAALGEAQRRLKRITPQVRRDERAIESFLNVAASTRHPAAALRLMNESGVLGRFLPEFGRVVAQMQFNMYHHFTVDEHTLRAVDYISDIEKGRFGADHPLSTEVFPKIVNRRALYLAMLLHDTGKGIGDQQIEGEISARGACERLGLPDEEVELVGWLVRHHLDMSDFAQKRDIGDPRTIAQFAEIVGTRERLRLLLVLTVADIRAVGPGVWNGWKGQLLRDLFHLTEAALLGGRTDEAGVQAHLAELARNAKTKFMEELGGGVGDLAAWIETLEDAYWLAFDSEALHWHVGEVLEARRRGEGAHVASRIVPERGVTQVLVYAPDRQGLFASLCAAVSAAGADIKDARAHTTKDGAAFDVFDIQTVDSKPFGQDDPFTLQGLIERMQRAALSDHALPEPKKASRRSAAFSIEPWARADNDITPSATVIEVSGRDRPGVLAELAAVFAEAGVGIVSAHIDAQGERLSDSFYVQTREGAQIAEGDTLDALKADLVATLRIGDPDAPADAAKRRLAVAPASTWR
ncbi:MAG: [protein-PII] uridylyltransferase, partial [Caulobacterales bacterium]